MASARYLRPLVIHQCSGHRPAISPMWFVGDFPAFLAHMQQTSVPFKSLTLEDLILDPRERFILDPGGMQRLNAPRDRFEIEGVPFEVELEKVAGVLRCMDHATERAPGMMRFANFSALAVMPRAVFDGLQQYLEVLVQSDAALHASLDYHQLKKEIHDAQQR